MKFPGFSIQPMVLECAQVVLHTICYRHAESICLMPIL